jgi:small subunit ribosomal protein S21
LFVTLNKAEREMMKQGAGRTALESMLSRFNRFVQDSGLFQELKEKEFYEKPSTKRRRKKMESIRRRKGKEKKNALYQEAIKRRGRYQDK